MYITITQTSFPSFYFFITFFLKKKKRFSLFLLSYIDLEVKRDFFFFHVFTIGIVDSVRFVMVGSSCVWKLNIYLFFTKYTRRSQRFKKDI